MRNAAFIKLATVVMLGLSMVACKQNTSNKIPISKVEKGVLIIYSSGYSSKTLSDFKAEEIEGVTGPTPFDMNCKIFAQKLSVNITKSGYKVKVVDVSEIKDYRELLLYPNIVLGCPAKFWTVSWEMKKLFDEHFAKIYVGHKNEFGAKYFASFAMAEIKPCAESTLADIRNAIMDCGGTINDNAILLTKSPTTVYDSTLTAFTQTIIVGLKN